MRSQSRANPGRWFNVKPSKERKRPRLTIATGLANLVASSARFAPTVRAARFQPSPLEARRLCNTPSEAGSKSPCFACPLPRSVRAPRSHNPAAPAAVLATTKNHYPVRAMRLGLSNPQSRHGTASRTPRSRAALLEPEAALAAEAISTALGLPSASAAGVPPTALSSSPAAGFWGRAFPVMSVRTVRRPPPELLEAFPGPVPAVFRAAVAPVRTGAPTDVSEAGPRQNSSGE